MNSKEEIRYGSCAKIKLWYNTLRRHMRLREFNSLDSHQLPPLDYASMVQTAINPNFRGLLISRFEGFKPTYGLNSVCIVATGSDGKMERHIQSKSEFIWLDNRPPKSPVHISQDIGKFLHWYDETNEIAFHQAYDALPHPFEVKSLTNPEAPYSYAYGNRNVVYPDRILNSVVVFGNPNLLREAKRKVYEEITADSAVGKHIREEIKEQLRISRKALESGISRGVYCFNLEQTPPVQYYNEMETQIGEPRVSTTGFKFPAMRLVQRTLDLITIDAIRTKKISIEEAIDFPTNTIARIQTLRDYGILPINTYDIEHAYAWFLQQYHAVQEAYKDKIHQNNERHANDVNSRFSTVAVPFDRQPFEHYRNTILTFSQFSVRNSSS